MAVPEFSFQSLVPRQPGIGTKVVRNTAAGFLRLVLTAPVPFILTPYLIRHLVIKGFGAWAVLLSMNSLTTFADLGFPGTLTKHVSEYFTRGDYVKLNRVINAGILIFSAIALAWVLAVNMANRALVAFFFRQSSVEPLDLQHALRVLTLAIALNLLSTPFLSIICGLQRLDLVNMFWMASSIITACAAALFVSLGWGINGLVDALVLTSIIMFVLAVGFAWHLLPQLRISPRAVHLTDIKELSSFSARMYIAQVASAVYIHTDKLLLAHFAGLTPAGWYDIGNDLALKIRSAPGLLISPLMPAAAELEARDDDARTQELYYRAHKYLAFIGGALVGVVLLLAHRFVELWLGTGFSGTARALVVLTVVQIANLACGPALLILIGRGNLGPTVRFAVVGMVGTLTISTILIFLFGFTGALYGTSLSVLSAAGYLVYMFHQETGYSRRRLLRIYVKPVLWIACLVLVANHFVPLSQLRWPGIIVTAMVVIFAHACGLLLMRYFDALDLWALERLFRVPQALRRNFLIQGN